MKRQPNSVSRTIAARRADQVRADILAELANGPRTTRALYEHLKLERDEVYRLLTQMQAGGAVQSHTDRRKGDNGEIIGATWALTGQPLPPRPPRLPRPRKPQAPPPPFVIPAPDPLLAALFGSRP